MSDTVKDNEFLFDPESLDAGGGGRFGQRRMIPRATYERTATLSTDGDDVVLYTRDANSTGAGFVTPTSLYDNGGVATIRIPTPDGAVRHMKCHVRRAREIGEGWVEGYVEFDEPTNVFSTKRINAANSQQRRPVFAGV